jgi:hypothetical protein
MGERRWLFDYEQLPHMNTYWNRAMLAISRIPQNLPTDSVLYVHIMPILARKIMLLYLKTSLHHAA